MLPQSRAFLPATWRWQPWPMLTARARPEQRIRTGSATKAAQPQWSRPLLAHMACRSGTVSRQAFANGALGQDPTLHEGRFVPAPFWRAEELAVGVDPLPPVVQALQVREAHATVHLGR